MHSLLRLEDLSANTQHRLKDLGLALYVTSVLWSSSRQEDHRGLLATGLAPGSVRLSLKNRADRTLDNVLWPPTAC